MKILTDKDFTALQTKANSFESIQTAVQSAVVGGDVTTLTAEEVVALLTTPAEPQSNADNTKELATLQQQVAALQQERATLTARVAELTNTPAEPSATIVPDKEPSSQTPTIAEFANANKGNYAAIIEQMKAEGLLPAA